MVLLRKVEKLVRDVVVKLDDVVRRTERSRLQRLAILVARAVSASSDDNVGTQEAHELPSDGWRHLDDGSVLEHDPVGLSSRRSSDPHDSPFDAQLDEARATQRRRGMCHIDRWGLVDELLPGPFVCNLLGAHIAAAVPQADDSDGVATMYQAD